MSTDGTWREFSAHPRDRQPPSDVEVKEHVSAPLAVVDIPATPATSTTPDVMWNWGVKEVAHYLGFHPQVIYKLAREGRVPCRRVLKQWRFSEALVREWVESGKAASA